MVPACSTGYKYSLLQVSWLDMDQTKQLKYMLKITFSKIVSVEDLATWLHIHDI